MNDSADTRSKVPRKLRALLTRALAVDLHPETVEVISTALITGRLPAYASLYGNTPNSSVSLWLSEVTNAASRLAYPWRTRSMGRKLWILEDAIRTAEHAIRTAERESQNTQTSPSGPDEDSR